jgi:hypothetical protein
MRGLVLAGTGKPEDAIREFRSGTTSAPGIVQYHFQLWRALHIKGDDREALKEYMTLSTALGHHDVVQAMEKGNAAGGYREAMRRAAEVGAARTPPIASSGLAMLNFDAGNQDRAFEFLEQAVTDLDPGLGMIRFLLSPDLTKDPRFLRLMQRIGLP